MMKINIEANTYIYPNPVTLVGTEVEGRANFMALGWVSRVNAKPPLVGIGVNRLHFQKSLFPSHELVCRNPGLRFPCLRNSTGTVSCSVLPADTSPIRPQPA